MAEGSSTTEIYHLNPCKNLALQLDTDFNEVYVNILSKISRRNNDGQFIYEGRKMKISYRNFSEIVVRNLAKGLTLINSSNNNDGEEKTLMDSKTPGGLVITLRPSNDQMALDLRYYKLQSGDMDRKSYADLLNRSDTNKQPHYSANGVRLSASDVENLLLVLPDIEKDFQIHNKKMLEFSIKRNKQKHVLRDFFSRLDEQSPLKKSKTELLKAFNLDG